MHQSCREVVICINCKSTLLSFSAIDINNGKIINGFVTCCKCHTKYPIINGLVCLLPADKRTGLIQKREQMLLELVNREHQEVKNDERREK